jgi:hypothetical protein
MSSPTSTRSGGTIRKGPTLRGGRYRPAIGRSIRVTKKSDTESDDEETTGLTHYEATNSSDYNLGERDSLEQVTIHNEKLETDADGKPIYHHGEETFGDLLAHPIQEYSAHKKRKSEYEKNVKRWSRTNTEGSTVLRSIDRSPR